MKLLTSAIFVCLFFVISALAQTPAADEDDIVKIDTALIQVDVTVLDKKGNPVTTLKPEDFQIKENGKVRKISHFSYVAVGGQETTPAQVKKPEQSAATIPPVAIKLRPEQVRRSIVLLVDDLGLSFSSMDRVREGLKKFVNEQMQPDDLVAIMRTRSGVGTLQQFTSDKRLLLASISKLSWSPISRHGLTVFEPIRPTTKDLISGKVDADGNTTNVQGNERDKENDAKADDFRDEGYTLGTIGAIAHIVDGLSSLPGRKGIILFSDGIRIDQDIFDRVRRVVERANRAGVVINTVDAKGLEDAGFLGPENDTRAMSFEQLDVEENRRRGEYLKLSEGMFFLAYETGGRPIKNSNDINYDIERILKSEAGYYLIAYEPDEEVFDAKTRKFNSLEVTVARPDLSVRYRSGFFGYTDTELKKDQSPRQQLASALLSPFGSKDIETRLTSVYGSDVKLGQYSRALLHIDARGIEFSQEPGGVRKTSLEIYAYVFGPDGSPISQFTKGQVFTVGEDIFPRLLEKGIIFQMNVPIEKPGAYQLRMAVRDPKNGKIGSASQFIEVPNLKKDRLALSGILFQNMTLQELKSRTGTEQTKAQRDETLQHTATRSFRRGTVLIYSYAIYNAKVVPGQGLKLQSYARLFRDGKLVYETPSIPVNTAGQTDLAHIEAQGVLAVGTDLVPGDYVLQIVTTDAFAKEKNQIAAQSIDFEVVQ